MQILPRLAHPHKGTDWLKTWSHEGCALWKGGGPEFEETFQEGACGWAEWESPNIPLLQGSGEMGGLHSSLVSPEITGQLMTPAVDEKRAGTGKLNTLCGKRDLSSLCSADFGLYKVSGSKAGTDSPRLAYRWAGQCWTWELQPPERHRSICWPLLNSGHSRSWTAWPRMWGATVTDSSLPFWKTAAPGAWWIPASLFHL